MSNYYHTLNKYIKQVNIKVKEKILFWTSFIRLTLESHTVGPFVKLKERSEFKNKPDINHTEILI